MSGSATFTIVTSSSSMKTPGQTASRVHRRRGRPPSGGREAIVDATLALLRERGVARLTTRDVAERAGVSEASVYYHSTDKAGLLRAVFTAGLQRLQRAALTGDDALVEFGRELERFLEQALPV